MHTGEDHKAESGTTKSDYIVLYQGKTRWHIYTSGPV